MNAPVAMVLTGAVAMASFIAMLFFLRFWRQTKDRLFLYFAVAFAVDALSRFVQALESRPDETEPFYYVPRLVTFALIIVAIVLKNRPRRQNP